MYVIGRVVLARDYHTTFIDRWMLIASRECPTKSTVYVLHDIDWSEGRLDFISVFVFHDD